MPIKVFYSDFKVLEGKDPGKVKELMARDSSWGTYVEGLQAAKVTCGSAPYGKWTNTQPAITNLKAGLANDDYFSLTFSNQNFNFASESIDHFVGTIAGDIILNPYIEKIEVRDFDFTDADVYSTFPGPNIGVDRLYQSFLAPTLAGKPRPILAFTLKPRFGMSIKDILVLYREAAEAGIDIFEEDERLVDPENCPFFNRIKEVACLQKDVKTLYSANITSDSIDALRKLEYCASLGIRMVKLDVLVSGFETLRKVATKIRESYGSNIAITVYPDAYGAYRRLSREFILRLSRLCGADIIYAGSPNWSRYAREKGKLSETIEPIFQRHRLLSEPFTLANNIKSTLPTITNDQHPSRAEMITTYFRKFKNGHHRYAFFIGGGISGFPADIRTSVREWLSCITHAATQPLDDYKPYDLSKYEVDLKKIGWNRLDINEGLNG